MASDSAEGDSNTEPGETDDERITKSELTSFRIHTEPLEDGEIQVKSKGEDCIAVKITDGEPQIAGKGTAAYAWITEEQARGLIEDIEATLEE